VSKGWEFCCARRQATACDVTSRKQASDTLTGSEYNPLEHIKQRICSLIREALKPGLCWLRCQFVVGLGGCLFKGGCVMGHTRDPSYRYKTSEMFKPTFNNWYFPKAPLFQYDIVYQASRFTHERRPIFGYLHGFGVLIFYCEFTSSISTLLSMAFIYHDISCSIYIYPTPPYHPYACVNDSSRTDPPSSFVAWLKIPHR
jgi:hypothetical protein